MRIETLQAELLEKQAFNASVGVDLAQLGQRMSSGRVNATKQHDYQNPTVIETF